jgi:dipeptidase E
MRLYLSSYKFGNHPAELTKLAGENKKAIVIANAADFGDRERRDRSTSDQIRQLTELGFTADELDLRDYFGKRDELKKYLDGVGMVWIRGGNAFVLQRAYRQSGFASLIRDMVMRHRIVYAGYSAAVCVAAPTLRGAELVDDPNIVPERYEKEFGWDGLGLIKYNVAVHYRSDHPESADVEKEVAYYEDNGIPYKTLRDGEVIIVDDEVETLVR